MTAVRVRDAFIAPTAFGGWIHFPYDANPGCPDFPQEGIRNILRIVIPQQPYIERVRVYSANTRNPGDVCYQLGLPGKLLSGSTCAQLGFKLGTPLTGETADIIHAHLLRRMSRLMRLTGLTGSVVRPTELPSVASEPLETNGAAPEELRLAS